MQQSTVGPPEFAPKLAQASDGFASISAPAVSVVIPVRNGGLQLSRCLDALRASEYTGFEVIVVDDGSTDDTRQIAERFHAQYLWTAATAGPANARNLGVRNARGAIIIFVDADVMIHPDTLKLIVDEFQRDPECAAVFGSYDEAPVWRNFLSQYKNLMHYYVHQNSHERAGTFWAGCGGVRTDVFNRLGGFDAKRYTRPSIEDIELGYRLVKAGKSVQLNKSLKATHLKKWTMTSLLRADILYRAIPWSKLILASGNLPRDLNLTHRAQVSAALVGTSLLGVAWFVLQAAGAVPRFGVRHIPLAELAILLGLLILNGDMYRFFAKKRGWWFTVRVVPMHWFYYLYSAVVFVGCTALYRIMGQSFARGYQSSAKTGTSTG